MKRMEIQSLEADHVLKLRYGLSGCCEAETSHGRTVYANEGWIYAGVGPPNEKMYFSAGRYVGLEIVVSLRKLLCEVPCAWVECGIDILADAERLSQKPEGFIIETVPEWDCMARTLFRSIGLNNFRVEDCRFLLLQLLWSIKSGVQAFEDVFLTRGQRALVARAEERMTHDLSRRYTVAAIAQKLGVSPASLKKYFAQAYGKPISFYIRDLRIKRAKELLTTTAMSIAAIANEVGYENQGKFGAVFRQETGFTPLEYRRVYQFPSR